ncbi:MAG: hypothetical protein OEY21_08545 [Nitrospira sp.]|nr:hypothetical protein [Nitrospira sp.]
MTEVNVFPVRVSEDRMKQQVIETLAAESNLQAIHDHEVKGQHIARVVNLRELDLLLDILLQLPTLDASFQCSANRIADARLRVGQIVFLLEPIQNRIRLDPPVLL